MKLHWGSPLLGGLNPVRTLFFSQESIDWHRPFPEATCMKPSRSDGNLAGILVSISQRERERHLVYNSCQANWLPSHWLLVTGSEAESLASL